MNVCGRVCSELLKGFGKSVENLKRSASVLSYYHNPGSEPLQYLTIGQVANNAADLYGDTLALISEHQNASVTFSEAIQQANYLAAGFLELGLNPGDRLALCSPNTIQWYITAIAAAKAGLIMVSLNPAYVGQELEYCLRKVEAKAIIIEETFKTQNYYKMMCKMAPEMESLEPGTFIKSKSMPCLSHVIVNSDSKLPGAFQFNDILQSSGSLKRLQEIENKLQADTTCSILFSSGTTGHPKGIFNSHFNLVNNGFVIGRRMGFQHQKHKILLQNPFFHVFGLIIGICNALKYGNTMVLPAASFKADKSVEALKKHQCTVLFGTPTMYIDLCNKFKELPPEEQAKLKSPQFAVSGGSLCSPELFKMMMNCFECDKVFSVYGQTEGTCVCFQSTTEDSEFQMTSTVGRLSEYLEAKLVDTKGSIVSLGVPGELLVKGYQLMKGYWGDEEKTRETITSDGWLKTGDLFVLFEGGYGKVVGRIKDMIIRGGENISPKEIEDFLETHPKILEAQVYGVKSERFGEEVGCSIRLKETESLTSEEVQKFCKGNIAHYKIPKYIDFVPDFPKTVSGKIQKYKLREEMERRLQNEIHEKLA